MLFKNYLNDIISSTSFLEPYAKCLQGEFGSLKIYSAPDCDGAPCWKPFNGHWNYFCLFRSCEALLRRSPWPCMLPGVGKNGYRAGRQLEEDRRFGGKSSESSSSKSTLGCYLLIVKRRWITSLGLWQVSWDEKKRGPVNACSLVPSSL